MPLGISSVISLSKKKKISSVIFRQWQGFKCRGLSMVLANLLLGFKLAPSDNIASIFYMKRILKLLIFDEYFDFLL